MKNKNYISICRSLIIAASINLFAIASGAQGTPADIAGAGNLATTATEGVEGTPQEQMEAETCERTKAKSVAECKKPTNNGWQAGAQALAGLTGAFAGFSMGDSAAGDSSSQQQTQQLCMLADLMSKLANSLNGGQNDTCNNAAAACEKVCNEEMDHYKSERDQFKQKEASAYSANQPGPAASFRAQAELAEEKRAEAEKNGNQCIEEAGRVAQMAQQQQQTNQQPQQGMQNCQAALNQDGLEEEQPVNCSLPEFQSHPSCTGAGDTYGKLNPDGRTPFNPIGDKGSSFDDLPLDEKRSGASGGSPYAGSAGGGMSGGLGMMGSGGGSGDGALGKTGEGAAAPKGGIGSLYGGNESSGGGGWGNLAGDDKNSGLSRFKDKKNKLKVPKKRKLAGHKLGAGSEFGLSTDDIWTRVYLRTNTRCTKQLVQCAANRSKNPYGKK